MNRRSASHSAYAIRWTFGVYKVQNARVIILMEKSSHAEFKGAHVIHREKIGFEVIVYSTLAFRIASMMPVEYRYKTS